jgi:flagellar secretion chaperone FliS
MIPSSVYQDQRRQPLPRIELILTLYDKAIDRLERACVALERGEREDARPLLAEAQIIVCSLAGGLNLSQGKLSENLLRVYEFVSHCARAADREQIQGAVQVLRILQDAFQEIRPDALQLERSGAVPSVDSVHLVEARA